MRCVDCHWFETKVKFGRDLRSCQDLGELPQNEACANFSPLNPSASDVPVEVTPKKDMTPDEVESAIGALTKQKYRDIFHEILAESFVMEQDVRLSVQTIRAQLQTQGAEVSAEAKDFERAAGKLVDMYVLYRLINATGMAAFTDKIMDIAIRKAFEPPQQPKV